MKFRHFRILFVSSSLFLFGCQDIIECIINREAELKDKSLKTGYTNNYYYDTIHAEINNEPNDNNYYYEFAIYDDLPPGLNIYIDYRTIIIEGYPEESGNFNLNIHLYVEYDYSFDCENELNDCDHLCDDDTTKDYQLTVI